MSAEATWFAGRLWELREQAGMTHQGLADRVGIAKATVADLEHQRYAPSWPTVLLLSRALGVDCSAFVQAPAELPSAGPGRPRKTAAGGAEQERPKRPRGRPRKAPPAQQEKRAGEGPGHKRKGKEE